MRAQSDTAIELAIILRDDKKLKRLLKTHSLKEEDFELSEANWSEYHQQTLLDLAWCNRNPFAIKLLVEHGMDLNKHLTCLLEQQYVFLGHPKEMSLALIKNGLSFSLKAFCIKTRYEIERLTEPSFESHILQALFEKLSTIAEVNWKVDLRKDPEFLQTIALCFHDRISTTKNWGRRDLIDDIEEVVENLHVDDIPQNMYRKEEVNKKKGLSLIIHYAKCYICDTKQEGVKFTDDFKDAVKKIYDNVRRGQHVNFYQRWPIL